MIKVPLSSKTPVSRWPRVGVPDYAFSARSAGGQALGAELREFDSTLQVESRLSLVSVESFRSEADIPGQPLGVFRFSIDDQELQAFRKLVADAKLFELQPQMKGHPGYTSTLYTMVEPPKGPIELRINDSDEETNAKISPLLKKLNVMLAESFKHPERAVELRIAHSAGNVFEVTVANIGVEKICFADPRSIVSGGPLQQAAVMIAEFPEQTPGESVALSWKRIDLPPMDQRPTKEPLVTLDPGGTWKATTAPYKTMPGKRYLAYFTWASYAGEPMVGGVYRIRGRADSPRLVIAP